MTELVYTLREACQILKFSRTTMWRLLKDGKITSFSYPDSNRVYFHQDEIQRFIETSKAK